MRDPKERLRDILDAIANIERYAAHGRQAFESDLPDLKAKVQAILQKLERNPRS